MKANVWFLLDCRFACTCYMNNMNYTFEGIYHSRRYIAAPMVLFYWTWIFSLVIWRMVIWDDDIPHSFVRLDWKFHTFNSKTDLSSSKRKSLLFHRKGFDGISIDFISFGYKTEDHEWYVDVDLRNVLFSDVSFTENEETNPQMQVTYLIFN